MAVLADLMVFAAMHADSRTDYAAHQAVVFLKKEQGVQTVAESNLRFFLASWNVLKNGWKWAIHHFYGSKNQQETLAPTHQPPHDPAGRVPFASPWVLPAVFQTPVDFVPWKPIEGPNTRKQKEPGTNYMF